MTTLSSVLLRNPSKSRSARLAMVSTYPPTQCGLATFSAALRADLGGTADVVRVVEQQETHDLPEVVAHLVNGSPLSAVAAVRRLNGYDAVIVQHEYGIFGGPDGRDVVALVEALTVPVIIVFHTVLQTPSSSQRWILDRLLRAADVAVTMTETARQRLLETYGADRTKVVMIPHGAVDHSGTRPAPEVRDRPILLTWGLLGPGKGIEWAIDALADLRDIRPRYVVLGKTHPKVLERSGEAYRDSLRARATSLGVSDLLELDDSYLPVTQLAARVEAADLVLLPYDSKEQVTSGVLIEAVAAGRPVVSTAFPHAIELLAQGSGIVVPQADSAALATALRRVLTEPGLATAMAAQAARQAPELFWGAVAARYRTIAENLIAAAVAAAS